MLARHVVLLTPSKSSRPSELLSCEQISIVTRLESTLLQLLILSPFRINTYKSVSKQSTLTPFRMNTYEKHRGGGLLWLTSLSGGSVLLATEKPPTREHLFRKSRISYDSCRPARLCPSYSYTCALFCTHQELNSFVFNRFRTLYEKHPGGGVPLSPNGSRPGKRGICLVLTSLHPCFPYFQKQRRPSRSDGGCCGKGVPSSGEKIVSTVLLSTKTTPEQSFARWRRRRGCLLEVPHSVPTRSTLCHRVVQRHGEERSGRFLPLDIRQRVGRIAKARIAALAHHHDLQIIGVPMLGYDGDRFFVSDLSRGNRMGDARSLRTHARDHLRAQVLLFQRALRDGLLMVMLHLALYRVFHVAKWRPHLFRRFLAGVQDEIAARHGIIDEHKRLRLSRGRQRPDRSERHFLPETSLAIPIEVRLRLSRDVVSVRESLRRLRNRDGAERHAGHDFSAVHALKAQQLDPFADHAGFWSEALRHRHGRRGERRRMLRSCQSGAQHENSAENHSHTYSAIHFSFSSSLPNCCELFAAAISAIPAINGLSRIVQKVHRTFSPPRTAVFTLSQSAIVPIILYASRIRHSSSAPSLSRQPHRLRQPVISHEKIHLDPFAGTLFIHRQTKCTQRAALHAHPQDLGIAGIRRQSSRQQREIAHFVVRHQRSRFRGIRIPNCRRTLHRRLMAGPGVRVDGRSFRRGQWRFQMVRRFFRPAVPPVSPAHCGGQHGRSGQRPRGSYGDAPRFQRDMLRAELLAQTHFHARGRLCHDGIFRKRAQLNPSRPPGILQRGAPRTRAGVLASGHALNFAQRSVALRVQSNRFKFFARHLFLSFHCTKSFIAPRSRDEARRETFPAWPSAKRVRDAAANESSQSGIRPFAPLPRNSFLPVRTTPRPRETPRSEERRVGKECRSRWSPYH